MVFLMQHDGAQLVDVEGLDQLVSDVDPRPDRAENEGSPAALPKNAAGYPGRSDG